MRDNQYEPLPQEYLAVGVFGIILNVIIIYLSVVSVRLGIRSKSTKRFFVSVIVMASLELPRFFGMAIQQSYTSRTTYCFHLLAGIFFFISFSIVCRQWSGLLQLGSYFRAVYGLRGLIAANITFACVDIAAVIACALSSSLYAFFSSTEFEVITFIEGVRNCVYSAFLSFYGVKLVRRFWHFSRLERQASTHKNILLYLCYCCTGSNANGYYGSFSSVASSSHDGSSSIAGGGTGSVRGSISSSISSSIVAHGQEAVFTKVVLRMTSVLVLSTACFVCRVCMLITKMTAIHGSNQPHSVTTPEFALFGFGWFMLSDFIPRALPTLAFILLMRTKRPAKEIKNSVQHKTTDDAELDEFEFEPLSFSGNPPEQGVFSSGPQPPTSKSELMIRSDHLPSPPVVRIMNPMLSTEQLKEHNTLPSSNSNSNSSSQGGVVVDNTGVGGGAGSTRARRATDSTVVGSHGPYSTHSQGDSRHGSAANLLPREKDNNNSSSGINGIVDEEQDYEDELYQPIDIWNPYATTTITAGGGGGGGGGNHVQKTGSSSGAAADANTPNDAVSHFDGGVYSGYRDCEDDDDDVSSVEDAAVDRFFDILTLNAAHARANSSTNNNNNNNNSNNNNNNNRRGSTSSYSPAAEKQTSGGLFGLTGNLGFGANL